MRWFLIPIAVAVLGVAASAAAASAKPKVAVTPVGGDSDDKMGEAVRELLDGKLVVVAPKDVERAMSKLGLSGELEEGDAQRLGEKLDAAVVVQGKLGKAGSKKTVKLTVWVRGKKPSDINVQYKSVGSEKFRDAVRDALLKRIGSISELDKDAGEEKPKKKLADADEEKPKKKKLADADEEKPKKAEDADEEKPKKKKKKVATADDELKVRKRKRTEDGDGDGVREKPAAPLAAVRVDAGLAYGARYLSWAVASDSTSKPPKVFTPAASGRFEAEIYPLALSNRDSAGAGLGIFGEYGKTFGLSIDVPRTMGKSATIDQAHYAVGALYRIPAGKSAVSAGVAYARRHYIASRAGLDSPAQLDMPDVDYAGVAPVLAARTRVTPSASLFAEVNGMLVMSGGQIVKSDSYGPGNVFGVGSNGGLDLAFSKQVGLRVAAEFNQVHLSFKGTGTQASVRKVSAANDRDFGASATLAVWY